VTTFAESKPARLRRFAEVTTLGDMWRIPLAPGGKPRNWEEVHAVGNLPCPRDEFGFVGLAPLAFSTFASLVGYLLSYGVPLATSYSYPNDCSFSLSGRNAVTSVYFLTTSVGSGLKLNRYFYNHGQEMYHPCLYHVCRLLHITVTRYTLYTY
jgi:hypothetical protein